MRRFLAGCKYVSDEKQFAKRDYWQPPEQFEETKMGDCDDYALWAWRQLLHMNYPARFVAGTAGRYGRGHAWVTFEKEGKAFLLEPLAWPLGTTMPRLSVLRYKPRFSMGWDGNTISYFEHEDRKCTFSLRQIAGLVPEWLILWVPFWIRATPRLITRMGLKLFRM
ncbi:MAG: transglutaminase domain-containing protein [Terriglobales bacterium]